MKELYKNYTDIWHCHNPSGKLKKMKRAIKSRLRAGGHQYRSDQVGNILVGNFDDPKPCIVAHMDSVHDKAIKTIYFDGDRLSADNGIGADDKCGIVGALECLRDCDINAIFTIDEEIGCAGALKLDFKALESVSYFIEIDRRGNDEVINNLAYPNSTGAEFEKALAPYMKSAGFKFSDGTYTDLSEIIPEVKRAGINLCAGYYEAHTIKEYVILSELARSIHFCKAIFTDVRDQYPIEVEADHISWRACGFDELSRLDYDPAKCDYLYQLKDLADVYYGEDDILIQLLSRAYEIGLRDARGSNTRDPIRPIGWY